MTSEGQNEPTYLTTDELAALLRTTPKTVHHWRYTGTGPVGTKVGRRVLYARADVERWLEKCRSGDAA